MTQGEFFLPHLPRVVSALARRFKDPDSVVTDACVDVVGSLAERVALFRPGIHRVVLSGPEAIGPHFVRPILDVIHETNSRAAQDTASRSLARVFHRCGAGSSRAPAGANWYPDGGPGRLALRLARMLDAKTFYAKPALLGAITALFRSAAGAVAPQLPAVLGVRVPRRGVDVDDEDDEDAAMAAAAEAEENTGGLLGALKSPDWPTRRGAAESVAALLYALGPALDNDTVASTPLVDAIEARVRECGFDKVRPARDAVHVTMSLVQALRRYGEERLPAHDVAAWRRFARGEVGEHVASLGEESRAAAGETRACEPKMSPGLASRKARRREDVFDASAGAKSADRRESIAAFREANIAAHGNKDVVVMVPNRPPPALERAPLPPPPPPRDDSHRASRPFEEDAAPRSPPSTVEAARGNSPVGAEGNTYEVASSEGGSPNGGDESPRPRAGSGRSSPEPEPEPEVLTLDVIPATLAPVTLRASAEDVAFAGAIPDEDAPAWMTVATQIEREGGFQPPARPPRVDRIPPARAADAGAEVETGTETGTGTGTGTAGEDSDAAAEAEEAYDDFVVAKGPRGGGRARRRGSVERDEEDGAIEEIREQIRRLAASQSAVLERVGAFVNESAAAIATLTDRVEAMENTVGAAVSASANVAKSAAALADNDRTEALRMSSHAAKLSAVRATESVKLELARERAELEKEKAQLRDAAAQLERAAAQLERVVPQRT